MFSEICAQAEKNNQNIGLANEWYGYMHAMNQYNTINLHKKTINQDATSDNGKVLLRMYNQKTPIYI